ncbi:hypothetical protein N2152v2_011289 [Parachlorella kessleri]
MSARAEDAVTQWMEQHLEGGKVAKQAFVGGSGWSSAYTYVMTGGQKYFVKLAMGRDETMFKGEALGLRAMYDTGTVRIPKVHHYGALSGPGRAGSFIVMEYLDMRGRASQGELGRQLALMHLATPSDPQAAAGKFGFAVDNTIGGTPQPNGWMDDWVEFFRERRIKHQLKLAGDRRLSELGERLCLKMESLFEGIEVKPSVLHGDLWSGNIAAVDGSPTIFDPATYYGHHEAEFGMSWCASFGGDFWRAYHEVIPKAPGWDDRHALYTLYHYLNHYNLFGSGYYNQCLSLLQRLTR